MKNKIRDFWNKYEYKIILAVGFVLVAIISFEAGVLKSAELNENPIIIEKPVEICINEATNKTSPEAQNSLPAVKSAETIQNIDQKMPAGRQDCAYVGSKNSNKYHLPNCRYAKNINPENVVCFSDENQAKLKGYLPDKNCIK